MDAGNVAEQLAELKIMQVSSGKRRAFANEPMMQI